MSGTIDQVEAIFEGVTSIWGRVLVFFVVCWVAFAGGIVIASTEWSLRDGFLVKVAIADWYFVPMAWMFQSLTSALHWWGLLRLLFLVVIAYLQFFTETNLCRLVCLLAVGELWFWWAQAGFVPYLEDDFESVLRYYFDIYDWRVWHPLFGLLVSFTMFAGWVGWRSWQKDHPSVCTP